MSSTNSACASCCCCSSRHGRADLLCVLQSLFLCVVLYVGGSVTLEVEVYGIQFCVCCFIVTTVCESL